MKTKIGLLAAALMLWSASAHTQNAPIFPGPSTPVSIVPEGTPLGFEQISLSGAAVGLDPPAGADRDGQFAGVAVHIDGHIHARRFFLQVRESGDG
jgi:hypothetical protein